LGISILWQSRKVIKEFLEVPLCTFAHIFWTKQYKKYLSNGI